MAIFFPANIKLLIKLSFKCTCLSNIYLNDAGKNDTEMTCFKYW